MRLDGLRKENARAWAEVFRLRKGIQDYLHGDYSRVAKNDKCQHGCYGFEGCEQCIDDYFEKLIAQLPSHDTWEQQEPQKVAARPYD